MSPLAPPQDFRKTAGVHRRGLLADRPAPGDVLVGTLYYSTDTGTLDRSDGTSWQAYAPSGGGGGGAPAAHHATHEPGGTDALVNAAWTSKANTFDGDQTVDGDLFVTGTIHPLTADQRAKIHALIGEPGGARTLMSSTFVSGLSLRHDETLALGRIACGNYDTQMYQPLRVEVESFQIHSGVSPAARVEHVRVHPSGGVTVGAGADHDADPGVGIVTARGLAGTPLNAAQLATGTVPDARLSANVQMKPIAGTDLPADVALRTVDNNFVAQTLATGSTVSGVSPVVNFRDPGANTDQKVWRLVAYQNSALRIEALSDAGAIIATPIVLDRTGNATAGRDLTVMQDLHGQRDFSLAGALYERGRAVPLGVWQDIPFATANFTGTAGGTWTVTSVVTWAYTLIGTTVLLSLHVVAAGSTIAGTPTTLLVKLPAGLVVTRNFVGSCWANSSGAGLSWASCFANMVPASGGGNTQIIIYRPGIAAFPAGTLDLLMTFTASL